MCDSSDDSYCDESEGGVDHCSYDFIAKGFCGKDLVFNRNCNYIAYRRYGFCTRNIDGESIDESPYFFIF